MLLSFERMLRLYLLSMVVGFTYEYIRCAKGWRGYSYLCYTKAEAENVYAPQILIIASLYLDMPKKCQKSGPE